MDVTGGVHTRKIVSRSVRHFFNPECHLSKTALLTQERFHRFDHPIYFNFEVDLLAFDTAETAALFIDRQLESDTPETIAELDSIRYLMALDDEEIEKGDIMFYCQNFPNLEHLLFRGPDPHWSYPAPGALPKTWFPKDDEEAWQYMIPRIAKRRNKLAEPMGWELLELRKVDGNFMCTNWKPPVVTVGNVSRRVFVVSSVVRQYLRTVSSAQHGAFIIIT